MKILFLSLGRVGDIEEYGIYTDLLRCFRDDGHEVYIVGANERRNCKETVYTKNGSVHTLCVKIGNITKCSIIEKGVSTLFVGRAFKKEIKKHFGNVKFDLVLYSTPPITLAGTVGYYKKRDNAKTYLLLKDIFPQNAVDIGMLSKSGLKGLIYAYFRRTEKKLYEISDRIGCMSQANADYVLKHNPEIDPVKVGVSPNSVEVRDLRVNTEERLVLRRKYGIPEDKKVFVYGGNLGKPQGIPFLIECLRAEKDNGKVFFLIVGDGTEYGKLDAFISEERPENVMLLRRLPKDEYDKMIAACDVGMIFLDHRFTIPNFPSRLLSYMQAGLPVLACTDPNTDIGTVITEGGFGWWCESNDVSAFAAVIDEATSEDVCSDKLLNYLKKYYDIGIQYKEITGMCAE